MNPFKELLFLQGHVTQATLLEDVEAAPKAAPREEKRALRMVPAPPQAGFAVGGCG